MRRLWPLVPVYVALLLWVDRGVTLHGQYVLGALTWLVLIAAAWTLSPARRAQVAVVVAAATVGEVTGSLDLGRLPLPAEQPAALRAAGTRPRVPDRDRARSLAAAAHARARRGRCDRRARLGSRRAHRPAAARRRRRARRAAALSLPLALAGTARRTRASSSRSPRSSCTGPRSAPGSGRAPCPGSGSRTATHRPVSPRATCGST